MSDYLISIIIPVHNEGNRLIKTLESILNQSIGFDNLELIFVDNKSTDDTRSILKKIEKKYENCHCFLLKKDSGTPGIPRNIGIINSTSEYVMFLDADDTYDKDFCKILYNKITQSKTNAVVCPYNEIINNQVKPRTPLFSNEVKVNPLCCEILLNNGKDWWMPWDKIYKKEVLIENEVFFPEDALAEDVIFNIKFLLNVDEILFINNYYGYNWNISNNSLSHDFHKETIYKFIKGYEISLNLVKDYEMAFKILSEEFITSLYYDFCILNEKNRTIKYDILNDYLEFEKKLDIDIQFKKSYIKIFNYLLHKKHFWILVFYSQILHELIVLNNKFKN